MNHGIDIGRRLSLEEIVFLKMRGFRFAARYYALELDNPKTLNTDEIAGLLAHRFGIVPVFEQSGGPPFNYIAGLRDGRAARTFGLAMGQPLGSPTCFAIDVANADGLVDYFNGAYDGLDGAYLAGVYGSFGVVKVARENFPALGFFWQTYAWSAGAEYEAADVYQYANGVELRPGLKVDLNISRSEIPWRLAA